MPNHAIDAKDDKRKCSEVAEIIEFDKCNTQWSLEAFKNPIGKGRNIAPQNIYVIIDLISGIIVLGSQTMLYLKIFQKQRMATCQA